MIHSRLFLLAGLAPCATGEAITVSFSVLGQPNIAVGFVDIDPLRGSCAPLQLGTVTDGSGATTNTQLVCNPTNGSLTIISGGAALASFDVGATAEWSFDARTSPGLIWRTKAPMVDVMYDAPFDAEDPLLGKFTASVGSTFLETKFEGPRRVDLRRRAAEEPRA
jgi:hypothetical protein